MIHGINAADFTVDIERNKAVEGFRANSNADVHFLPIDVNEKFPNLAALTAFGCMIKSLNPKNFKGLTSLELLDLHRNKIEYIDTQDLRELTSLRFLDLSDNYINGLADDSFIKLTKLEVLDLENNQIKCIAFSIDSLIQLRTFDISFNRILALPNFFFRNNRKMTKIMFNSNKINSVPHTLFDTLNALTQVSFKNNTCIDDKFLKSNFNNMKLKLKNDC